MNNYVDSSFSDDYFLKNIVAAGLFNYLYTLLQKCVTSALGEIFSVVNKDGKVKMSKQR